MTTTPYDIIGKEALYDMIDYFYTLVEKDERLNHLFPGDFAETSRKQNNFNTVFGRSKHLYRRTRTSYAKKRHMDFTITEFERDAWLENMQTAINRAAFPQGVGDYLFERLRLTANHMVNS